jgi:hypothetical protein
MPQPLSSKDQANFRQLVKFYEAKQYKKALKTADQLLKKNPNHGDTEAMKALVINSLGNADEGWSCYPMLSSLVPLLMNLLSLRTCQVGAEA